MTKVQLQFTLTKPLTAEMMSNLEKSCALYGILRLKLEPALNALEIEFDATRLTKEDVEAILARSGIAAEPAG